MAIATGGRTGTRRGSYGPRKYKARRARGVASSAMRRRATFSKRPGYGSVRLKKMYLPTVGAMRKSYVGKMALNAISSKFTQSSPEEALKFVKGINAAVSLAGRRGPAFFKAGSSEFMHMPGKAQTGEETPIIARTTRSTSTQVGLDKGAKQTITTLIYSGKPSSKSLLQQGRLQGFETKQHIDTKAVRNANTNPIHLDRTTQTTSHGFNERTVNMLPMFTVATVRNVMSDLYAQTDNYLDISYEQRGPDNDKKDYALIGALHADQHLTFINKNAFLPLYLKFHIVTHKKYENDTGKGVNEEFTSDVFNAQTNVQRIGAVPQRYQFDSFVGRGGVYGTTIDDLKLRWQGRSYTAQMSNKFSFKSSPTFREKYEIVSTFVQKLEPNDLWHVKHRHYFGSGLDYYAARMATAWESSPQAFSFRDADLGYFYVVESYGPPVQCEKYVNLNPPTTDTYQGTAPGTYHWECKKSIKYVVATGNRFRLDLPSGGGEGLSPEILVKVYSRDDGQNNEKEENISFSNLLGPGDTPVTLNQGFIPLLTDLERTVASPRAPL